MIAGVFFSQTSVDYFAWDLAAVVIIGVSVIAELTALRTVSFVPGRRKPLHFL